MRKIIVSITLFALMSVSLPINAQAAAGIYASGGKTIIVGSTLTVSVVASGATFDTVHGAISISGPVSVTSFSVGDATWISRPSDGGTFDGAFLGQKKTSFTVATIKLKGTAVGSGSVTVSGASLKNAGVTVGTGAGGTNFTISKAPDLPGAVVVTSASHPDQNTAYEATTIDLAWTKDAGVDNFSYLLDQAADTAPPSTATDANTAISYADKAVGTYYFHIRAHKPDGWGSATHFKITIKEPEAKVNDQLAKPSDIRVAKASDFINDVTTGFFTGVIISGKTEPGYTANIILDPAPTLPEGRTLTALADNDGNFELLMDFPIRSGFYKMTIQGQLLKVLTPMSDQINFEISQAKGGKVSILTDADRTEPAVVAQAKSWYSNFNRNVALYLSIGLIILLIVVGGIILIVKRRKKF